MTDPTVGEMIERWYAMGVESTSVCPFACDTPAAQWWARGHQRQTVKDIAVEMRACATEGPASTSMLLVWAQMLDPKTAGDEVRR